MQASLLRRLSVLLAALALGVAAAPAVSPEVAVTRVDTTVDITCAFTTLTQDAIWFLPAGTPKGLIWVQHGFLRSGSNMADLASKYAAQGYIAFAPTLPTANIYGCTLEDIGNNTDFLDNVADLFGLAADPSGQLARSFAAAVKSAGRSDLAALPAALLLSGHSAGGEAVIYVANRLRTAYPDAWDGLRGLVLLDPVNSVIGDNMASGLEGVDNDTALSVLTVSAAPELCNSLGAGTALLQATRHRAFVGVRVVTGVHTDAEGNSTDIVGELACGFPAAANVAILQTLAVGWAVDFFGGTTTATYYPGGDYYASQLSAGTINTLAGAS